MKRDAPRKFRRKPRAQKFFQLRTVLKTIVLPEGHDDRTLEAAQQIVEKKIAKLIILGDPDDMAAILQHVVSRNAAKTVGMRSLDVRVVSATNRTLTDLVERGEFREDLLYRINLIAVHLPPPPGVVDAISRTI